MAISIISAYQLSTSWELPAMTGLEVFTSSISLEDLVDPAPTSPDLSRLELGPALPTMLGLFVQNMSPELRSYLSEVQDGPRAIAKRIFQAVVRRRIGSFTAGLAEPVTVSGEAVFRDVPPEIEVTTRGRTWNTSCVVCRLGHLHM